MKLFLSFFAIYAVLPLGLADAATFNVANGDVTGLKNAINSANSNNQDDTIELAAGGTYTLTTRDNGLNGLPLIAADGGHKLTIHGNGATIQRSSAGGTLTFRIFFVGSGGNLTISGLTLTNAKPPAANFHGGAIFNDASTGNATLTVTSCTFTNNSGDYGGAIFSGADSDPLVFTATLTVSNSTFLGNAATQYGGAIWTESSGGHTIQNISNSTFIQNTAANDAGAVSHDGSKGSVTGSITNCAFSQNTAGGFGGAIDVDGRGGTNGLGSPVSGSATLHVTNCTFDQNQAARGGGLAFDGSTSGGTSGSATVTVDSCTFSGNFSTQLGDAIYLSETGSGTTVLQIGNSILASKDLAGDFDITTDNINGGTVTVVSSGYNLSDDAACGDPSGNCNDTTTGPGGLLNQTGDQRNTDPMLDLAGGLKDNGGLTKTIALQGTSPALDKGKRNTISLVGNDQRGEFRPFDDPNVANATGGDGSDIGAYEADVRVIAQDRIVNDLRFTFTTILGHNYEIQSSNTPSSAGTWTSVTTTTPASPIAGTGGVVQLTVNGAFSVPGPIFYRVHQL